MIMLEHCVIVQFYCLVHIMNSKISHSTCLSWPKSHSFFIKYKKLFGLKYFDTSLDLSNVISDKKPNQLLILHYSANLRHVLKILNKEKVVCDLKWD